MNEHPEHGQTQEPMDPRRAAAPDIPEDASSQALADALKSSFAIIKILMVILVIVFLFSGFFQVGTQEKALVLRFGKPAGGDQATLLGPGPHWAFPYPIDEVVKVPIGQIQAVHSTVGWYNTSAAKEAAGNEPPPGPSLHPALDGYAITSDGNIMHVRGTLLYRITEPAIRYIFDFENASNLVQNIFNNAIIYAAAYYTVDDAWARDIAGFREKVRSRVEDLAGQYKLGITIDQINLQTIPPRRLKEAFDAVLDATVRRTTTLNEARGYENQTISKAKAEAASRINIGETERNQLVVAVEAEAKRFKDALPAFMANPELFVQRRQLDSLQKVLANVQRKYLLPDRGGKPIDLRIELNAEQEKIKGLEPQAEDHH